MPPALSDDDSSCDWASVGDLAEQALALSDQLDEADKGEQAPLRRSRRTRPASRPSSPPPAPEREVKRKKTKKSKVVSGEEVEGEAGPPLDPPCTNCLRSAIAGKGAFEKCLESSGRSSRCVACRLGGHKCVPLPGPLVPFTRRLLRALHEGDKKLEKRCKDAAKLALEMVEDDDDWFGGCEPLPAASSARDEQEKAEKRAHLHELIDYFLK